MRWYSDGVSHGRTMAGSQVAFRSRSDGRSRCELVITVVRYATRMMTRCCVRVSQMTLEDEEKLARLPEDAQCSPRSVPVPVSD
jgi:hypothetical protein